MSKKIKAAAVVAVLLAAGGGGAYYMSTRTFAAEKETEVSYREYSVSKGSITVGAEESGTLSIERSYVTFPCDAEVTEVYVKEGVSVAAGDPLLKLSPEDIADAKDTLYSAVKDAKEALEEAEYNRTEKLREAGVTLENSVESGKTAQSEYEMFLTKNNASKESASKNVENLKSDLAEYEALRESYPDDKAVLDEYESNLDEREAVYKEMQKEYKSYQAVDDKNANNIDIVNDNYDAYLESVSDNLETIEELKETYDTTKEAYEKAQSEYESAKEEYESASLAAAVGSSDSSSSSSDSSSSSSSSSSSNSVSAKKEQMDKAKKTMDSAYTAYNEANVAYSGYYLTLDEKIADNIEGYEDKIAELEKIEKAHLKETEAYKKKLDEYNDQTEEYREEYEDYKSDFQDTYGQYDLDDLDKKISELNDSIADAQLEIESDAVDESSKLYEAYRQAEDAAYEAQSAQTTYNHTVAALDSEVEKAAETLADAQEEYDTFCSNVSDEGVVYADCAGIISGISVTEGSDARADVTLVTMMDTRHIYISASVSEEDITSLYTGQECSISLTAYENKTFSGVIDTISAEPARSSGSVTYTVTVRLDDESGLNVREGMSGNVTFLQKEVTDVLYTNINAITFRDGESYVTVYDESGSAVEKPVTTGFSDGRYVEITDGVSAGDTVLAEITLSDSGR